MTSIVLTTSLFFISCGFKKDNGKIFEDNPRIELLELNNGKEVILRKDYYGTYSFNNWNAYNIANIEIHRIEEVDYKISKNRLLNLNDEIYSLPNKIPKWLKTEEVIEDIYYVQEEYSKLLKQRNLSTKMVRQNWKEFTEKFDDLRDELDETIEYNVTDNQ